MATRDYNQVDTMEILKRALRTLPAFAAISLLAYLGSHGYAMKPTTVGFLYFLIVLAVAIYLGFVEAIFASLFAGLCFNYFFLPPLGKLKIADPQDWVALASFLSTSVLASRLSAKAREKAEDAEARQRELERLYTLSRSILLIETGEGFLDRLIQQVAATFELRRAALLDKDSGRVVSAGVDATNASDDAATQSELHYALTHGAQPPAAKRDAQVVPIRLGATPIAAMAIEGETLRDSLLQNLANLVAIGLERARAHDLQSQMEAAKQSEQLRTTILDAMAHEFKTPLTSVLAATSTLKSQPELSAEVRGELVQIADEESHRLLRVVDDAITMGRIQGPILKLDLREADPREFLRELAEQYAAEVHDERLVMEPEGALPHLVLMDIKLMKLAARQIIDNAMKYSTPRTRVDAVLRQTDAELEFRVTNEGPTIPMEEQRRLFDRLYRGKTTAGNVQGSGLGLNIARNIAQAHKGELTVESAAGRTTFILRIPVAKGAVEA